MANLRQVGVPRRGDGLTAVELLIVIALVGIVAAFAYPGYRHYLVKSRRVDAHTLVTSIAARQERFHVDHRRYAASAGDIGYASDDVASAEGFWTARVTNVSTDGKRFEVHANVVSPHEDPQCAVVAFDERGRKGYQARGGAMQWDGAHCW